MAVKIGHASIDENRTARGGNAGDQTKKEVCTRNWYNKPWIVVIRPNDSTAAEKIARAMEQACANDKIGYDQGQRTTLYKCAKELNWDLSKIDTPCECDCSSLVAVCVNAAGIAVSKDIYTGNQEAALRATGAFTVLTDPEHTTKSVNLKRGDILLGTGHTAIVLSDGSKATTTPAATPAKKEECNVTLPMLRKGYVGASAKALQILLIGNGFSCGNAGTDGHFGGDTEKAVKAYQKAKGLEVDGIVGSATWGSLLK